MNLQMVNTILDIVSSKKLISATAIEGWKYRLATFSSDCEYTYTSDWADLNEGQLLPLDRTTLACCEVEFPKEILCGENNLRDYLFIRFSGMEGYITIDGEIYHGHDGSRDRIPLRPEWAGQKKKIEVVSFCRRDSRQYFAYAYFGRVDLTVEDVAFSMRLAWDFYNLDAKDAQKDNVHVREGVLGALKASMLTIDTDTEGEAFHNECVKANDILMSELNKIDDGDVRGRISFVGHTHIDVAWLWQLKDTVRKCAHTFSNVLRLMDEYPEFEFSCSQMQLLDYTKQYYPDLYAQLKQRIAEGRFELVGPMWVESDCNVVSGESLVRQFLYGINFMKKEFGIRNDIAWLPDTFGFQPNLPQIMQKTGTHYFYSNKIHWQGQNRFPYSSFRWKGIDGSEVTASVPRTMGFYNGSPSPDQIRFAKDENLLNGLCDEVILPYGHGDGGGGPTREMIENAKRLADYPGLPRCRMETAAKYFARIGAMKDKLPVWYGDLYIETHRGTLTTEGKIKKNNRMAEILYQSAEKLGVAAQMAGYKPDWNLLHEGWKEILLLQFHDILPGSSVNAVYSEDCEKGYKKIFDLCARFVKDALCALAGKGDDIWVFNPLGFARSSTAEYICDKCAAGLAVADANGRILPANFEELDGGKVKITFCAENVPALGAKAYKLIRGTAPAGGMKIEQKDGGFVINNPDYTVCISGCGKLTRYYDKKADREALAAPGNDIKIFMDGPQREDAWNIYPEYREREIDYGWKNSVSIKENSALRTVVSVKKEGAKCIIYQDITLYPGKVRIDFVTHVDWRERHRVMRVYFPCNVSAPYAALEVGFGTYMRPSIASTPFETSRFEVCAHKFIDLSEGEYGVSVLNNCKYGHDVQGNTLGITLLRSTTHPDTTADYGEHDITYSVYPHAGDWRQALTAREGLDLNTPFITTSGNAAGMASLASCSNRNVIIDTLKAAEDGHGYIVRLYECNGNSGKAELSFAKAPKAVIETNMIEEECGAADYTAGKLRFSFTPYEVKTYRLVY